MTIFRLTHNKWNVICHNLLQTELSGGQVFRNLKMPKLDEKLK